MLECQMNIISLCVSVYNIVVDKVPNKNGLQVRLGPQAAIWKGLVFTIHVDVSSKLIHLELVLPLWKAYGKSLYRAECEFLMN